VAIMEVDGKLVVEIRLRQERSAVGRWIRRLIRRIGIGRRAPPPTPRWGESPSMPGVKPQAHPTSPDIARLGNRAGNQPLSPAEAPQDTIAMAGSAYGRRPHGPAFARGCLAGSTASRPATKRLSVTQCRLIGEPGRLGGIPLLHPARLLWLPCARSVQKARIRWTAYPAERIIRRKHPC
jgi:hypothetical protein